VGPILVVNAGSTSLKLALVDEDGQSKSLASFDDVSAEPLAVAHRIVHGGLRFVDPVVVDEDVEQSLMALEPLAPLHNPPALEGIRRARAKFPELPHIAVFDTAFHRTIPAEASVYAIPERWREEWGIRRYGFHGLSVEWSVERAGAILDRPPGELNMVACHLGGGCSVTAVRGGRSVDTTMGFSPLEGIPMSTRSGSVDPGALVYVLRECGLDLRALDHALNFDSGVEGLAPAFGGMREIEAAATEGDPRATLAIGVFIHRLAGAIGEMATATGGLDVLAFTAGIGEHSAAVRSQVCERLRFLGVRIDAATNAAAEPDCDISEVNAPVRVLVIRAREEIIAARAAKRLLEHSG
jgi:acetate kinase